MTDPRPIRSHDELVDYIRARKDELGLSNAFVDERCGMTSGHCDKLLGPSRVKGLSRFTLDYFFTLLAFELVPRPNAEQEARMRAHGWEVRDKSQIRTMRGRISRALMERARPLVLSAMSKAMYDRRMSVLSREHRSKIAKKAAKTRWRMARAKKRRQADVV